MAPSFEFPAITQPGLNELLSGLTDNACSPADILLRLTAANIHKGVLATRPDLPLDAAAALAADRSPTVRVDLAFNPYLQREVQAVLARDPDPRVRARLAAGDHYFITAGVHGRQIPDPLAHDVYELLARDPEPKVRRSLASNRYLPDDVRTALLDDTDARTATNAAVDWPSVPAGRIGELLSRVTAAYDREMILFHLDGPLPAEAAHAMLADIAPANDLYGTRLLRQIAHVTDLDRDLTSRFLASPDTRAAVAANPTLPAQHVAALAGDPDNRVRAAVVARRDLDPVLRESIPVDYDDKSTAIIGWLLADDLPEQDWLTFARSHHQIFRKTLAMRPGLPDEAVEILARDESFAVRLFVCEQQPDAPGWLLAQTAAEWTGMSRRDMLAHKNFPVEAVVRLARSDDPRDRRLAAAHPGLPADVIESLLTDDDRVVRHNAAINPAIPASRLIELLGSADPGVLRGAAANRMLPSAAMYHILGVAGL